MEQLRDTLADAPRSEAPAERRSGRAFRPGHEIGRATARPETARTALERYKVSLRRYSPVQKGTRGLPWPGEWHCARCGETVPGRALAALALIFTGVAIAQGLIGGARRVRGV